jgi:hypothetical protein
MLMYNWCIKCSYREAVLDTYVFQTLDEVREQPKKW